ncbi:MAG: hypothetical protein R2785_11215 [Flavobacteriaceae bacterium]
MKKALVFGFLFLATSCVTSKITSNKSPNFNEKISKLYVMVKGTDSAKPFFYSFTDELRASLKSKGIESTVKYIDPLSLESESDINQGINDFGANLIMIINQTESRTTVNNGYGWGWGSSGTNTGGTFDVQIFQLNSKNPVWRANLKADGSFGLKSSAKLACEKLIGKLLQDSLL